MTFQFKIQIKGITKPPVWRRLSVPANSTFDQLHMLIQVTFGWGDYHMYQFSKNAYDGLTTIALVNEDDPWDDGESKDPMTTKLSDIFNTEKQKYTYIYDFGDDWIHSIVLEKITDDIVLFPSLLAGKGQCPPEDCGGIWGYEHLKEVVADKTHPEYPDFAEWLGLCDEEDEEMLTFDPKEFDLVETQEILRDVLVEARKG